MYFHPCPKNKAIKLKGKERVLFKMDLLKQQKYRCLKCPKSIASSFGHLHHIQSRGAGGGDTEDNCVILCWKCHRLVHDGKIKIEKEREQNG